MEEKPEALRLADALEISSNHGMRREAAAELRRLHAENETLRRTVAALRAALAEPDDPTAHARVIAQAYENGWNAAKATGDNLSPTEPVAWDGTCVLGYCNSPAGCENSGECRAGYAPPQRKPLTEKETDKAYREICRDLPIDFDHTPAGWIEQGIRYAERAHGITGETA